MTDFSVQDGHFWLDGRPQLINAAEFHYFRTPVAEWPQRLGLLQQAGFNTLATYIPWLWHQLTEGESDLTGHSHPLRDLAGFLDLAAEMGFWLIPRPGPYIMAETINEGIPPWVFANYPQTSFINQRGQVENIASYLHPDFLACVRDWYRAVFAVLTPRQVTRGGRALMIQLDNEAGMPHWVRNIFDRNPDTVGRLAAWLRATYGDALAARYPAAGGDLAGWLDAALADAPADLVDDYRHFYRDYLRDYFVWLWDEARANGMDVPPVVNIHGFTNHSGGRTFPIGLSQLVKAMELPGMVSATDVYPLNISEGTFHQLLLINAMTQALHNPQQALFSIEFQSGGNPDYGSTQSSFYDLHSRLCFSCGMRAINHYLFTAGENDPLLSPVRRHDWGPPIRNDGTVRRHYQRYVTLSQTLNSYGEALVVAQPQTVTTVGFLLDYFMTEVDSAATQEATNRLKHQRDVVLFEFIARGLALTHRPFDARELARAPLEAAAVPTLWAQIDIRCPAAVQQKLVDYARGGGRLVLVGRLCAEDERGAPCTILADALGVTGITRDDPFTLVDIGVFDYPYVPASFVESYTGDFVETFAARAGGAPVGVVQPVGDGRVWLFGAALTADNFEDLDIVEQLAQQVGVARLFGMDEWADVRISRGAQGDFVYVNNYQDDPVAPRLIYAGRPLFGGAPVRLPARRGVILPLGWQAAEGVRIEYATGEVKSVVADADGLTLTFDPPHCVVELALDGYTCEGGAVLADGRVRVAVAGGRVVLGRG